MIYDEEYLPHLLKGPGLRDACSAPMQLSGRSQFIISSQGRAGSRVPEGSGWRIPGSGGIDTACILSRADMVLVCHSLSPLVCP